MLNRDSGNIRESLENGSRLYKTTKDYFQAQMLLKEKNEYIKENDKLYKRTKSQHDFAKEPGSDSSELISANENPLRETNEVLKLCIYNMNGNSNELSLTPPNMTCTKGSLEDIHIEEVYKLISVLKDLNSQTLTNLPEINIPIYIINIYNTLTNGNKNEITY